MCVPVGHILLFMTFRHYQIDVGGAASETGYRRVTDELRDSRFIFADL